NDAPGLFLLLAFIQHETVLRPGPFLKRREAEPTGSSILMDVIHRMAGGEMTIWVPLLDQRSRIVGPLIIAVAVEIVAQVPGDVREGSETVYGVTDEPVLVFAGGGRMDLVVVHIEDQRNDHVAVAGKSKSPFEFPPVVHVKAGIVEAGMIEIVGFHRRPRRRKYGEVAAVHHRLAVKQIGSTGDGHPHSVDLQLVQTFDAVVDHAVIAPSDQPVCGGQSEEIMLASSFSDEVPGILEIAANRAAPSAIVGVEDAARGALESTLAV